MLVGYLDAGSGSLIASAIAAGFAGVAVVFKVGFRRFASVFSRRRSGTAQDEVGSGIAESS